MAPQGICPGMGTKVHRLDDVKAVRYRAARCKSISSVSSTVSPLRSAIAARRAKSSATPAFCSGVMRPVMHITMAPMAEVIALRVCASGLNVSFVMGSPFAKLVCVRAANVAKRAAHLFRTHRHSIQRAESSGVSLPDTFGTRRQAGADWCAGAVGALSFRGAAHG